MVAMQGWQGYRGYLGCYLGARTGHQQAVLDGGNTASRCPNFLPFAPQVLREPTAGVVAELLPASLGGALTKDLDVMGW